MSRTNDITGAVMTTKAATDAFREGYERIFGKKTKATAPYVEPLHTESLLDQTAARDAEKPVANPPNSPIVMDGYAMREKMAQMSDREWAAQPANLREGATTHVPGVGDL